MITFVEFPTVVFSLLAGLLATNVWLTTRHLTGPSPKRRAKQQEAGDQSDA